MSVGPFFLNNSSSDSDELIRTPFFGATPVTAVTRKGQGSVITGGDQATCLQYTIIFTYVIAYTQKTAGQHV